MWNEVHNLDKDEREAHRNAYGGYNDFPRNWREITDEEMAQSEFFVYAPMLIEHRQMLDPNDRRATCVTAQLFFMRDGTGFGLVNDYWGKTVKWFRFDGPCEHEMEVVRAANCYRESKCIHCDYTTAIDSG